MLTYIINLDSAGDRWTHIATAFAVAGLGVVRVPAVDGRDLQLPHPDYAAASYRHRHGREANIFEVACYLSHLRALAAFLETDAPHAIIGEDDIVLAPALPGILTAALQYAGSWNVLRLTGLSTGHPLRAVPLGESHSLCVSLGRMKGAGAYVVDRAAARAFTGNLLPMRLPYDHAFDREWCYGLTCASVQPFPISQADGLFRTSIQTNSRKRLSSLHRWTATYPYQVTNEVSRWFARFAFFLSLRARR